MSDDEYEKKKAKYYGKLKTRLKALRINNDSSSSSSDSEEEPKPKAKTKPVEKKPVEKKLKDESDPDETIPIDTIELTDREKNNKRYQCVHLVRGTAQCTKVTQNKLCKQHGRLIQYKGRADLIGTNYYAGAPSSSELEAKKLKKEKKVKEVSEKKEVKEVTKTEPKPKEEPPKEKKHEISGLLGKLAAIKSTVK